MTDTARDSLNHIVLSPQELDAIQNILVISYEAFKLANYPAHSYRAFLKSLADLIQQGAMIATLTRNILPSYSEFSQELDTISPFMRALHYFI